jgi:peptide/nickel transport system substrate-binding protein
VSHRGLIVAAALAVIPRPSNGAVRPRYGGEIAIALPATPRELDPARASAPADVAAARAVHATLLEIDPTGALRPGLLASLPEVEADGRVLHLRLRPGLRFHDGTPLTAADVAASLARLLAPATASPHAWLAWPIDGAELVRDGRAVALPGVQVLSETELRVTLAVPLREFVFALASLPTAVVPRGAPRGVGAGPFRLSRSAEGAAHLSAFEAFHRGRPFADGAALAGADARRAERALERGEVDLVLRPEAVPRSGGRDLPALCAAYAVVNARRLGPQAEPLRRVLGSLDRSELTRLFVRGPSSPLASVLPAPIAPPAPPPAASAAPRLSAGTRITLLVPSSAELPRAVADRIQVKLFDRGLRVAVETIPPEALGARLGAGDYDIVLAPVTFVSPAPSLAVLQLAWALGGPPAARRALTELAAPGASPSAVAAAVADALLAVPLFATGLRASFRPELQGLQVTPDGAVDLGDLWILPASAARGGAAGAAP